MESWDEMEARHARERHAKMMEVATLAHRKGIERAPIRVDERMTIRSITALVAKKYGLEPSDLRSKTRTFAIAHKRFEVFDQAKKAGHPLSVIARYFDMDHTSVLNGIRRHQELSAEDIK